MKQALTGSNSDFSRKLNIAHINLCTEAEGPHKRMAIWFQGCDILCKGCCNPELWEIKPAHLMTVGETVYIAEKARSKYGIEGVTFLGGEPTLQENLRFLARGIREAGLGVILFTGRRFEELDKELIPFTDLIVDGKFDREQPDAERNLIGSKNQKMHFITDRYRPDIEWFSRPRDLTVEVNIGNGEILFTGDVF